MLTLITTIFFSCLILTLLFFNKLDVNDISKQFDLRKVTNLIKGIVIISLCMIISQYYNMTIHEEQLNALKNRITELERNYEKS